jgi:hypothetical protein
MYGDSIKDLAGHKIKSLLKETVTKAAKKGEAVFFDSVEPSDDVTETALASINSTRKDYEDIGAPVLADLTNILTPHMEISRQRTICTPKQLIAGHTFRDFDEIALNHSESSIVNRQLMKKMVAKEDKLIYDALFAANVSRGKDSGSLAAVPFPAAQSLANITAWTGLTKDTFAEIRERFETNYAGNDKIFCVVSPTAKFNLIKNSGDKLHSSDFVNAKHFESGDLPDIYGVHVICDPQITGYGTDDAIVAWSEEAITFNQSKALDVNLAQDPTQQFNWVLQIRQYANAVRVDDKKVVKIDVNIP